jgi:hypothetical protein
MRSIGCPKVRALRKRPGPLTDGRGRDLTPMEQMRTTRLPRRVRLDDATRPFLVYPAARLVQGFGGRGR